MQIFVINPRLIVKLHFRRTHLNMDRDNDYQFIAVSIRADHCCWRMQDRMAAMIMTRVLDKKCQQRVPLTPMYDEPSRINASSSKSKLTDRDRSPL